MERKRKGFLLAGIGILSFVGTLFFVLPIEDLYLISLLILFCNVIMIGVGSAIVLGFDKSIDIPSKDCYFCKGAGMVDSPAGRIPCPRCGGTGISPDTETTE